MKKSLTTKVSKWAPAVLLIVGIIAIPATSFAAGLQTSDNASATAGTTTTSTSLPSLITQGQKDTNTSDLGQCGVLCQVIKTAGAKEISNRLNSLNNIAPKIATYTNISASNKAYLSAEVDGEISGLTALQTKLAGDTTLRTALSDAESIYTGYRVYALVLPKIQLVRISSDQLATQTGLTNVAQKLQAKITADSKAGKNVASLQTELNVMTAQIKSAQQISSSVEEDVLPLLPSNYNSNHQILHGDSSQLKTARADNESARADAKNIESWLRSV